MEDAPNFIVFENYVRVANLVTDIDGTVEWFPIVELIKFISQRSYQEQFENEHSTLKESNTRNMNLHSLGITDWNPWLWGDLNEPD